MGRKRQGKMPKMVQVRIKADLKEGKLEDFGYKMNKTARARHSALAKAVKVWGALSVYQSLTLLETWNKNENPHLAKIAEEDSAWVGKTYGIEKDGFQFTRD